VSVHPRLSVNPFCSVANTFAEDLALWRTIGVPRAGVTSRKMAAHGWQRALDDIHTAGLHVPYLVHGIYTPVNKAAEWQHNEQDLLIEAARITATLGAPFVYLCTGPSGGLLWEEAADEFEQRMAPVLEVAREVGVRIAIENNHTSRPELGFVFTIADAALLARRLGMGICVDMYCCWLERALGETLRDNVDLVDLVQVSDFVVGTLSQPDRQVPGDADLPLRRCLELVFAAGYEGFVDLELLGPAVEAEGYTSAIRRGMVWLNATLAELDAAQPR
jgi:sugar phosphate isomerase/epimerase